MKDTPRRAGAWSGDQVRQAREELGELLGRRVSQDELGRMLRISDDRAVRRWEKEEREISGPAEVALELLLEKARREAAERPA